MKGFLLSDGKFSVLVSFDDGLGLGRDIVVHCRFGLLKFV